MISSIFGDTGIVVFQEDKILYSFVQRQLRKNPSQNPDRFAKLQSQISLIYRNLGPGPESFPNRYLKRDGQFDFASWEGVWDVLDVLYRNFNEEKKARESLNYTR